MTRWSTVYSPMSNMSLNMHFPTNRCDLRSRQQYETKEGNLVDPKLADATVAALKATIGKFDECRWMENAVLYPLGPKQIRKIRDCNLSTLPIPAENQLLINNIQSTAFVAANLRHSHEHTIKMIEQFLGPSSTKQDEVMISEPSSGYGIQLSYGKGPEIVQDPQNSKFAVIFDNKYKDHVAMYGDDSMDVGKFYEELLNCRIVSTRMVNDPEKKWMEQRLERSDLRARPLRVLEFKTSEERNKAMDKNTVEHLNLFFCDTQFGYKSFHESLHLYVKYDMTVKDVECVSITLMDGADTEFVAKAFRTHGLKALHSDGGLKMLIQDFPRHMFRHEVREWFVSRICDLNSIQYETIERFSETVPGAINSALQAKKRDIRSEIDREIRKIARGTNHNWKVSRKNRGEMKEVEQFTVHFDNVEGLAIVRSLLAESNSRALFQVDQADQQGPEIRPCYRKTLACSRSIRAALHQTIRKFDHEIRTLHSQLTQNENPVMEQEESIYYRLRIHEEWKSGSDAGVIGVMGWTPDAVTLYAQKLELLLQPNPFGNCPNLLYGIGEIYAKSLAEKYEDVLVIEVDKFNEEIKVIGDGADEAIEDLKNYSKNRGKIGIYCEIPMHFPYFNETILPLFTPDATENLKTSIGINHLCLNLEKKVFKFEGSVEQYDKLVEYLEELSLEVYKNQLLNRVVEESAPKLQCPICWTETGFNADFYRFQCGHVACRECANAKIRNISSREMVMECDVQGCGKFVAPSDILNIILDGPDRLRDHDSSKLRQLINQVKEAILSSSQDVTECNTADCTGLLIKSLGDPLEYKSCACCSRKYCRLCLLEPHAGDTCEAYRGVRRPEQSVQAFMDRTGMAKACPKCGTVIEKISGCNHMGCKCGEHWCWICLFHTSSSGPVYAHMSEMHGGLGGEQIDVEALREDHELVDQLMGIDRGAADRFAPIVNDGGIREERRQGGRNRRNNIPAVYRQRTPSPPPPPPRTRPQQPPRRRPPPQPRAPSPPPRAAHLYELPRRILDILPLTEEDVEMYLNLLNRSNSLQEQNENIERLVAPLRQRRDIEDNWNR